MGGIIHALELGAMGSKVNATAFNKENNYN